MIQTLPQIETRERSEFPDNLPVEDGEPLESNWHRIQINLLVDLVQELWRERTDYFAGGNMFIYFSRRQALNYDYRGPDFFVVKDEVEQKADREVWKTWEEDGRFPDLIVELLSPTTAEGDLTIKRRLYERTFKTPEYYCCEPKVKLLYGWRLRERSYHELAANERGWLWSEELGVWVGAWEGEYERVRAVWLRLYDREGRLLPTGEEAERERAEHAEERAEHAEERAEHAEERAEHAEERAAQETAARREAEQRAAQLETELAQLRAEMARQTPDDIG